MDARTVLSALRAGKALTADQIGWFARGLADGGVTDEQAGAFAMGVCTRGLRPEARVALTLAMRDSGQVLRWDMPGPVIDKHSTGGIGDCVSLLLAPALAALGTYVPMISGRGLGHTGGTLDKLESIPGLKVEADEARFRRIVEQAGCAIVAASADIAPADKRLYAVRDVTGTVDSLDLITASILSKKLAAGLEALVLDVKLGSGAFMQTMDDAVALAEALVSTANGAGCRTSALITDMNQPVAPSAGNALEVMEVMQALTEGDPASALCDLTADLGGELLRLAGMADDRREGAALILQTIASGAAAERFGKMVSEMGGPADFVDRWRDRLPGARVQVAIAATRRGYVTAIDGRALGEAVVRLGGGRLRPGDRIDPSVGLSSIVGLGDEVAPGDLLAMVHAASEQDAEAAADAVAYAIILGDTLPDLPPITYRSVC
ncbi:thymidine phosphorylase [Anianabacter salinae]|uniref:thymidine phosphorylase n=1 Tax=Anianabacter salinae TaxID=2851023 RepID=UPI00225DD7B1|nr:thymidine phosphorylase [Anianabacter salinae]MBV0911342.1 thymidine phosphorylase [Anianabacter salinae]